MSEEEKIEQNAGEESANTAANHATILSNVEIEFLVSLGKAEMSIKDILQLQNHASVELDREVGSLADIYLNDRLFARGQLLSVDGEYAIKIVEILEPIQQDAYLENFHE